MSNPVITGIPPETWTALLNALSEAGTDIATITEQGITTMDQLKLWLAENNLELVEISEVVGYTIAKVSGVDPANTNAVSTRVVTDIVTTGGAGTAVSTVTTAGNRTLGLVTKLTAVSSCISLLVSTIGAGLVTPEVKTDLVTAADPFTIDGEHVLVLIDENGKTHYQKELIEAIRAKAAELGIFSGGGLEPAPALDSSKYVYYKFASDSSWSRTTISPSSYNPIRPCITKLNTAYGRLNGQFVEFNAYKDSTTQSYISPKAIYAYATRNESDTTYRVRQFIQFDGSPTGVISGYHDTTLLTTAIPSYYSLDATGADPICGIQITYNNVTASELANMGIDTPVIPLVTNDYALPYAILGGTETPAVEGIEPNPDTADDLKNLGIPVEDILPQLEQNKISTASPTDDDLENKSDWYPASTTTDDVFEDGATEDDTSTAPEGDVDPDIQPDIIEQIKELIEQLTEPDPDDPDSPGTPVIEVGDNGDTPPENPPLEPPSDVTGSNGLWSIYNPSLQQVNDFGAWLWSDTLADQFKRIFNSPIDGVIGFHMLYCTPTTGASRNIKCGFLQSPVSAPVVSNPYVEIDCGSVTVEEFYGNALDYDNTRISLYLPFVGIVPLDTNIVMGSELEVTYRVDVLTGTCLAQVKVIKQNSNAVMYSFAGNCAVQVPLTATTYTGVVGALLNGISAGASIMTGNLVQASGSAAGALASGFSGLSGAKQSGTFGANAGALGIRIPYVIITHPVNAMPYDFGSLQGVPSNSSVRLSSLSGYTRVKYVHLENIGSATEEEINMIKERLMEGVII